MSQAQRPIHLSAGRGEHLWVVEDLLTILVSGKDSGGRFCLMDVHVSPGKGTPPHVHSIESETFYITEGEVDFWVDGEILTAKAGDTVYGPVNIPHCYSNKSGEAARMLVFAEPAGMDDFFRAIGDPAIAPEGAPVAMDIARLESGCRKFGITLLPSA